MRTVILGLILLAGITGCQNGNMFRSNDGDNIMFGRCDPDVNQAKFNYYKREYNRLWNVLTKDLYSERLDSGLTQASLLKTQKYMTDLEYKIDAEHRNYVNSCRALLDCDRINPEGSSRCDVLAGRLNETQGKFDALESRLSKAADDINKIRYQTRPQGAPSNKTADKTKKTDTQKQNDNNVNQDKTCKEVVGTVFTECRD